MDTSANESTAEREGEPEEQEAMSDDGKGKFKFESTMRRDEAVAYFEAIVSGLKQGSLHFKQGDRSLTVNPGSVVEIQVKAARKGKEAKVAFEIEWNTENESELEISSS